MSLSFSFPRFTSEQLRTENEAMTEREQRDVTDDLYGRNQPRMVETPERIESSLERLDAELECIPDRQCYEMAQVSCPEYVNSTEFRLLFLRADLFNEKLAAIRLVKYWDTKVELFGTDKAFHKLTLDDFDEEDQVALTQGGFRIMPEKDDHDRNILVSNRVRWDNRRTHRQSMLRLVWYILHVAVEDEDTQRNGLVCLFINQMPSHSVHTGDAKLVRKLVRIARTAFPLRLAGMHHIIKNRLIGLAVELYVFTIGPVWRARYRRYMESSGENIEALAAFGIHSEMLPPEFGGTSDFDYDEWLGHRRHNGL